MSAAWQVATDGLLLHVRVTPRGGRDSIIGIRAASDGRQYLAVKVAVPPQEGAANEALRHLIAKESGLSRARVQLVAGEQAREKRLKLTGDPEAILAWLKTIGMDG